VDHERRRDDPTQPGGAVAVAADREELAGRPVRVDPACPGRLGASPDAVLVEVRRRAGGAGHLEGVGQVRVPVVQRRHLGQHPPGPLVGVADPSGPGGGHHRRQRGDPLDVRERQVLGDHAAHRHADDVGAVGVEVVEQPDQVAGQVRQRVGGHRPPVGPAREVGDLAGQDGGTAVVAVVGGHGPEPGLVDRGEQLRGPDDPLGAEPGHEQHHLAVRRPVDVDVQGHRADVDGLADERTGDGRAGDGRAGDGRAGDGRGVGGGGGAGAVGRASSVVGDGSGLRVRAGTVPAPGGAPPTGARRWLASVPPSGGG
jgi:hypothetical protein